MEWRAQPGPAGNPAQPQDRRGIARSAPLGVIPYWCEDPKGGRKPINAKCETVRTLPSFREAYRKRRCILPVDGFFEWKAIKGQKGPFRMFSTTVADRQARCPTMGEPRSMTRRGLRRSVMSLPRERPLGPKTGAGFARLT